MSSFVLHNGNCVDVLKTMEENSVDSVVTDPPYELGFMGKSWDSSGIAYSVEMWSEVMRVLKPGGHLLAFSGTRTYHRMVVAIEDAGFDIRDQIGWVYGCLSDDTEIVTPNGIKPYTAIKPNDLVLCYDKYTQTYSYMPVEEVYEYDIKDTAYRIQSDHTDQIVSRNHRCIVERGGREIFAFAEELSSQENIPFLENLSGLQQSLSDSYQRTGYKKQNLQQTMFQQVNRSFQYWIATYKRTYWKTTTYLSSMWDNVLQKYKTFTTSENSCVFKNMQRSFAGNRMESSRTQGESQLVREVGTRFGGPHDWRNQPCLEGWSNIPSLTWKLQRSEVCSLSSGLPAYGEERRVCHGAPSNSSEAFKQNAYSHGSSASYKPRSIGQSGGESDVICQQLGSQVIRGWKGHKTTLATVTPIEYEGKIWCVKVPTGAFVAVRDGKAFTTGNSGFPKSMNIGKAIDKHMENPADDEEVIELKNILTNIFKKSGKTRKQIDTECGFRASNYLTLPADGKKFDPWVNLLPPQEKWKRMKEVLNPDEETSERLTGIYNNIERRVIGQQIKARSTSGKSALPTVGGTTVYETWDVTAPATEEAKQWDGWGTALKPAWEPICVARKPLSEKTVAKNVLKHGTGGINIDDCRVDYMSEEDKLSATPQGKCTAKSGSLAGSSEYMGCDDYAPDTLNPVEEDQDICTNCYYRKSDHRPRTEFDRPELKGRFPANIIHDGSDEVVALFPESKGQQGDVKGTEPSHTGDDNTNCYGEYQRVPSAKRGDTGSAARFFKSCEFTEEDTLDYENVQRMYYAAKASRSDRNSGLDKVSRYLIDENTPPDIIEKIKKHINTSNESNGVLNVQKKQI